MIDRSTREAIIARTQHWLTRAVIGLNLCPFAKGVHVKDQIRYVVSEARTLEDALMDLSKELRTLADADPERVDTTLLIVPHALADFTEAIRLDGKFARARANRGLVQLMRNNFDAAITVSKDGMTVGGTSIMGLMMLAASPGSSVLVSASGNQAAQALDALDELIQNRFGEEI